MQNRDIKHEQLVFSPLERLTVSLDSHLSNDSLNLLGIETYERYVSQLDRSKQNLQKIVSSYVLTSSFLFLISSGNNLEVPFFNISVSEINAIQEILIAITTIFYALLISQFIDFICYTEIVNKYGQFITRKGAIDPDFLNASRYDFSFFHKIFRNKADVFNDFTLTSRYPFKIISFIIIISFFLLILFFLVYHFIILVYVFSNLDNNLPNSWNLAYQILIYLFSGVFSFSIIIINVPFKFDLPIVSETIAPHSSKSASDKE